MRRVSASVRAAGPAVAVGAGVGAAVGAAAGAVVGAAAGGFVAVGAGAGGAAVGTGGLVAVGGTGVAVGVAPQAAATAPTIRIALARKSSRRDTCLPQRLLICLLHFSYDMLAGLHARRPCDVMRAGRAPTAAIQAT